MTRKNQYANRARISSKQLRQIIRYLALDLTASQIALLTGLNRNTVNRYVRVIRARIAEFCETQSPFGGEVEVDESYFGARRIKGKRGRGAYGKTISLEYTLTLKDKKVLDTNVGDEPQNFTQDSHHIIPGLETTLEAMKVGESKQVTVDPEQRYGPSTLKLYKKCQSIKSRPMHVKSASAPSGECFWV